MYEENRYQFIVQQIRDHWEKIYESFMLFLKLSIAIIGGFAWLISKELDNEVKVALLDIVPWALALVGFSSSLLIIVYLRGKWIFRRLEYSILGADKVKLPHFPKSCLAEIVMIITIIIGVTIFWVKVDECKDRLNSTKTSVSSTFSSNQSNQGSK